MFSGAYTALMTPMGEDGGVDGAALERLLEFQMVNGVSGIVAVGTTGESPTLDWEEHHRVVEITCELTRGRGAAIAGTGSNSTRETLEGTARAARAGADAVLLVDPYYNGPSSLEIRREYLEPVARAFAELQVIPYVVPGRTGTALCPEDLALLAARYGNVGGVKEATGDLENMARIRQLCGEDFAILSGDDDLTLAMISDPAIRASGAISVVSNVVPGPLQRLTELARAGQVEEAEELGSILQPLFGIVHVETVEDSPHGPVRCKARSPLPIKTLMNLLGMPAGPCRPPLGRMTRQGLKVIAEAVRQVLERDASVFAPLAEFFGVDVEARIGDESIAEQLTYAEYEAAEILV